MILLHGSNELKNSPQREDKSSDRCDSRNYKDQNKSELIVQQLRGIKAKACEEECRYEYDDRDHQARYH